MSHALDAQDFDGLVDPRLENNYIESEMFRMIEAAAACVRHSAVKRPRMSQVVLQQMTQTCLLFHEKRYVYFYVRRCTIQFA